MEWSALVVLQEDGAPVIGTAERTEAWCCREGLVKGAAEASEKHTVWTRHCGEGNSKGGAQGSDKGGEEGTAEGTAERAEGRAAEAGELCLECGAPQG